MRYAWYILCCPNFQDIGKYTSCTRLEAFHKVCLDGEGIYIDSKRTWTIYFQLEKKFCSLLPSEFWIFIHPDRNYLILDNYKNKIIRIVSKPWLGTCCFCEWANAVNEGCSREFHKNCFIQKAVAMKYFLGKVLRKYLLLSNYYFFKQPDRVLLFWKHALIRIKRFKLHQIDWEN